MIFINFQHFHQFGDSKWSRRLCTGHQNLGNIENIAQTFRNASGKPPSDHLGWSTRVGRVIEFRKFLKIMIFDDFL